MLNSFKFAFRGIQVMISTQRNARIHLLITTIVFALGLYLGFTTLEWCLIVFATGTVWTAEAFNTAIEFLVDVVSPEFHPLAGNAKDVAAAAVLISAIGSAIIGILIFAPYLARFFH